MVSARKSIGKRQTYYQPGLYIQVNHRMLQPLRPACLKGCNQQELVPGAAGGFAVYMSGWY